MDNEVVILTSLKHLIAINKPCIIIIVNDN